ncbi:MAG: beta-galactosidase [Lachnospiraceae bacterium]|nr:beta-galactosidase [Lachnospiraceae bacterium]
MYQFQTYEKSELLRGHLNLGGVNPQGEHIDVTNLYLERGGKPFIGVMGEYHFSRANREDWYTELCKMKAGGISIVATYMFWIYHEEIEGEFDFSGDLDIRKFVEDAKRAGLDVVLRIGPWAHGECRNGGFPDWLLQKPYKIRGNFPEYMEKARIWYEKIYQQVKGKFYKDGGNIIAIQLENELVDDAEHLLALKKLAVDIGFIVPIYTVTGWNSKYGAKIPVDEVLPVFGGYADAPWSKERHQLPLSHHYVFDKNRNDSAVGVDVIKDTDKSGWRLPYEKYPYITCEIGPGLQPTHHRRPIVSPWDAYAMAMVKLGCGNNLQGYYMYHGGINKIGKLSTFNESKETGYPNDYTILNYDFQAPLSAYGEARDHYGILNIMHLFLHDFGEKLAPMETVLSVQDGDENDLESLRYCMRTDGNGGFVFVNHYQRLAQMKDLKNVVIDTGSVGNVVFPGMDISGDKSFFLPFHMDLAGRKLTYATAQPLCRVENTYFFMALDGIKPEYQFADGAKYEGVPRAKEKLTVGELQIVTLTWEEARYTRKLSGKLYIGCKCDIYETEEGIKAIQPGDYEYLLWNGETFEVKAVSCEYHPAVVEFQDVEEPFEPTYIKELNLGSPRKRFWKKVTVSNAQGFIEIPFLCDVAQIYADGELVADVFYYGKNWRVPAVLLYGKECYLVMSELKDDFYREF